MKNRFDLTGKKALVTGSSRGIGRTMALALAENGADVAVHCAGRAECAQEVVRRIQKMGRRSFSIQENLETPDCAEHIWREVERQFGGLDILVLNASIEYKKPWMEITAADFDEQMHVNVRSTLALIQKAVPCMKTRQWGRIVTVGSVQEKKPHPDMLIYSSGKAAQALMAKSLASQLAPAGITVNNLEPGVILTERNAPYLEDKAYRREVLRLNPVGYLGEPEDCAGAILLLCSEAGRYITGIDLLVDGGKAL